MHDNKFITGLVYVKIPGDINGDGKVDDADLATVCDAYGSRPSSLNWDPESDFNTDDTVNILDLMILSKNYGRST